MNPVNGLFAHFAIWLGLTPIDFFAQIPLLSIIIIVSWQWLPFAALILLTAIQSLDREQLEAADLDGAGPFSKFFYIVLPHLSRAVTAVILIETIFLLSIFAEILVTTSGGPGYSSTNITYLIYTQSLLQFDVGGGSAGGIVAVIIANIVAIFLNALNWQKLGGLIMTIKDSRRSKLIYTIAAWTISGMIFFPILWTLITSFKTEAEAISASPSLYALIGRSKITEMYCRVHLTLTIFGTLWLYR